MSGKPSLFLASASPRRLELLKQVGITPDKVIPADIDETPRSRELPLDYACRIAREKAEKISNADGRGAVVLAADTVVALGRRILPKAETDGEARACLALMSGRRHRVITAVAVASPVGDIVVKAVTSIVQFKRLSAVELEAYITSGEWRGKAGGYAVQGQAAGLIPFISGSYSNIVGLPLYETMHMLQRAGL